jgi:UDPglucose--hexose-1-phosphate uridylyltransferase
MLTQADPFGRFLGLPDLRKDPITGRWVIIASDRARRPTDFTRERVVPGSSRYCPFCPGHEGKTPPEVLAYRTSGAPNEPGWHVRVVPSKFPALRVEGELKRQGEGLYDRMTGIGAHEVILETPDHLATLSGMSEKHVADIMFAIRDRILDLRKDGRLRYILVFKNHGEAAGATLEHPHSQLIALPVVPKRVQEEIDGSLRYFQFRERCIFCDMLQQESQDQKRVVLETDHFFVIAPFASRFPFEMWIVPRRHDSHFERLDAAGIQNLGWVLGTTLRKIEVALEQPPYNAILHTAPVQDSPLHHYHWHFEIIPKLTKVAGFEWGSGVYINPTPPEEAAKFLKDLAL